MTDRINALTVVLDRDMRDDDVEVVVNAIQMIRYVKTVKLNVAKGFVPEVARERIDLAEKLIQMGRDLLK